MCHLTRARQGVRAEHQLQGGGWFPPPPEISKTTQRSDRRKTALDRSRQVLEKILRSFLGQVNIEVTRGHQRSNFPIFHVTGTSLQIIRVSSVTKIVKKKRKKTLESPWISLSLRCPQIWAKVNSLSSRGHQSQNGRFRGNSFSRITFLLVALEQRLYYHRVCLVNARRSICVVTSKSQFRNLTPGRGHVVTQTGQIGSSFISNDAYWRDKHIGAIYQFLSFLYQKLLTKMCWWPRMTSRWSLQGLLIKIRTRVINNGLLKHYPEWIRLIWWISLK